MKTVLMRELDRSWRRRLGVPQVEHAPALEPGEGLNAAEWAANEFGGAPLGDKRLSARLVKSAGLLAAHPGRKINASSDSGGSEIAGFYRLIEAPAESEVTPANILAPHRERSVMRMRGQGTVLAIQDGTDLNFSRRPGCDGLQLIGRNQTAASALGLHMHATLAVTGTGLPLGVLRLGLRPAGGALRGGGEAPQDGALARGLRRHRRRRARGRRQDAGDLGLRPGGGRLRAVRRAAPPSARRAAGPRQA